MPRARLFALALALSAALPSCASLVRSSPSRALFHPESSRAAYYNAGASPALLSPFERELWRHARGRFAAAGTELALDPALAIVAREYGREALRTARRPAPELVDFLLAHAGVTEPHPVILHASFPRAAASDFLERFTAQADRMKSGGATHLGLSALQLGERVGVTAVLLARNARLEPTPQRAPSGAVVPIRGALRAGYESPSLLVTTPSGEIRRVALRTSGRDFDGRVELSAGAGAYTVEVLASGPLGPTVVSLFPLYASVAPPTEIALPTEPEGAPRDPVTAETELLRLINDERGRKGLPPLRLNARLSAVARGHSRDMRENGFVGHRSPKTGTLLDRLRSAGVVAEVSLENIARNDSIVGAHRGLMQSPGHRRNILDPRVREVGVGVVVAGDERSPELYITQNFILPVSVVDPLTARAELWNLARERRTRTGAAPLSRDEILDRAAGAAAERLLQEGTIESGRAQAIVASELRRAGASATGLTAHFFIARSPAEVLDADAWGKAGARRAGIGVAQRAHSGFGEYALCVVLLLSERPEP